ncbi:hypothetical protein L248_3051 [Schleiferilactobacillus shenzhenensis LY-73]|uniref:Uncharacterized protein n=1 Tax=Schleiferilactobacillus shenzhenensis LY-73 TaxID=1231336 RepID=U4TTA4_9LACO|nr:hypothetical protein L248_3051 [Schleiferilactobacillus shenzhenensis LY-73]
MLAGAETDQYSLLSQKFTPGIFSQETALILHGLTTEMPLHFYMTFPQGYNNHNLAKWDVTARHLVHNRYAVGITTIQSPSGDPIKVYDKERTLLDVWADSTIGPNVKYEAVETYLCGQLSVEDDLRLAAYARDLYPTTELITLMEVLAR